MRRRSYDAPDALVIDREEFRTHYWRYQTGEHATFAGPSGWGKTQLVNELLEVTATSKLNAIVLCMKNRDATASKFIRETDGFHRATSWPPSTMERVKAHRNPRGWVLWPKHTHDPDRDADKLYFEFRKAMLSSMKTGNRILVSEDVIAQAKWLGLTTEIQYIYWNGRSDGCGLWSTMQRPAHAPPEAYSQSHHIFLANSPEKRDRDRYREIGGIDSETIEYNLSRCQKFQWLYIHRESGGLCIIDR